MPLLTNDTWRAWLGESVRAAWDAHEIALWAYVLMPEHVHLLLMPRRIQYNLSRFLKQRKQPFSERVFRALRGTSSLLLKRLRILERPGKDVFRFWQEGPGHDMNLWSLKKALEKARYGHRNPVERKWVSSPEQWMWSSFRWLEMGKRAGEPLSIDDWNPVLLDGVSDPSLQAVCRQQWHDFQDGVWKQVGK